MATVVKPSDNIMAEDILGISEQKYQDFKSKYFLRVYRFSEKAATVLSIFQKRPLPSPRTVSAFPALY